MQPDAVWNWLYAVGDIDTHVLAPFEPHANTHAPCKKRPRLFTPSESDIICTQGKGTKRAKRMDSFDNMSAAADAADNADALHDPSDQLRTPKAPLSLHLIATPACSHPRSAMSPPLPLLSASNTDNETGSHTSRKRKRSESPQKQLDYFRNLPYPVRDKTIEQLRSMPEPLQPLVGDLRKISKGHALFPKDQAATLRPLLIELVDDEEELDHANGILSSNRGQHGTVPVKEWAQHIVDETNLSNVLGRHEAAWNCHVHFPVLQKACHTSAYSTSVRTENVTTASINTAECSDVHAGVGTSRKADFAITMVVDQEKAMLLGQQGKTLSHTTYLPLARSPPTITIETKLESESGLDANAQLTAWAYAQVSHLRKLSKRSYAAIPALPLLIVQGSSWSFKYFEPRADHVVKWSEIRLGETSTLKGVYQVHAGLQRLITWAETVYRPWFEQYVIATLLANP